MNKVFKVVYSKSKGCYVVVPETAKNNNGKKKVLASVLAGLALVGAGAHMGTPVEAYRSLDGSVNTEGSRINIAANATPNNSVGVNSIVVGYQNTTDNEEGTTALGANNQAYGNSGLAVGNENYANGGAATAIGAGNEARAGATVALGNKNNANATSAVAVGNYNNQNYTKGSNSTTPKQAGNYSTAVGSYNAALGDNSVSVGSMNTSHVADTVTIGQNNNAKTMGGISIGKNNLTDSTNGGTNFGRTRDENSQIAIGRDNVATHLDTIAIGRETKATGSGATVIGARAEAAGNNSIAIGQSGEGSPKVMATGVNSIAIGMQSQATGESAIAEGPGSRAGGKYGVALGRTSKANDEATTALGNAAEANIANGVALGSSSVTTTDKGVLGYNPSDPHERKYAPLTGNVQTATTAAVSIGNGQQMTRQLTGLAAGTADTDAVNVAQLKNVGVAVTGNTGKSDFLTDGGKLNVIGTGRVSTVAAHDGAKDSKITVGFDDKGMVKAGKNVTVNEVTVDGRTTYTINAADTAAKYDFLTNATANGGKLDGEATPTKVQSGTTVNYAAGKNLTVKQDIETSLGQQTYTYSLNKDLKEITSITNNGGPTMNFGPNNISVTGGNLDLGGNNITNLKSGGDVINNAANIGDVTRISKANDLHVAPTAGTNNNVAEYTVDANKKVTLTYQDGNGKTVNGPKAVIDLSGLKTGDMSSFNVKSTATEGKVAQGSAGVQEIRDGKTVEMQAGKNMTIKQTNNNGNAAVEFALNKDIDLTPDGSIKIGDTNITDNGLTINGGPSITKTGINAGGLNITNVKAGVNDNDAVNVSQLKQVRADERHIKPGEYAVDNNGKVTMTYVDGNNKDVPNETAVITGIAKQDLSNINNGGKTVIKNLAKEAIDMENGKNTTASHRDVNGVKTFKVDVEGDLTDITSITNKAGDGKIAFGGNQTVNVAGDHNIAINAKAGDITGLTNVTLDAPDFAKKGRAATEEQLNIVNNKFNNTVGLTGNTGATELQKLNKQGGLSFGVVGANNGEYIKTTASGSNVVADLSDNAKNKLNSTVEVQGKNAAKVTSAVVNNADGSTKTIYTVDVNNVKPTAASTEKVQAKADVAGSSDKNIAKVAPKAGENFGDAGATYEVNVSRNDVKDAAREAVTVNTTNTTNNPITVTPVQDEANHNTTYQVTFDGDKAAKQIPLTYKANGTNDQKVTLDKGLNFTNGRNTTASVAADGVVKYDVNKDLVDIHSISNTTNGPKMEFGPNSINITNGPINMGDQNITNLKSGGDVVNNAANIGDVTRISKANDLHIAPTSSDRQGETTTSYAYDAASKSVTLKYNDGNGANQSGTVAKIDLSGLADQIKDGYSFSTDAKGNVVGNHAVTAVGNGKTVSYAAGDNLTVKQDIDAATGEHTYTYALSNNVDLTPNGSLKIGDTIVNDGGLTIKNGPSVTKTGINAGNLNITNVKAGVNDTDAVNVKQLKDARTVVTSNDKSVTINKTENGNQVTYDLHVAPGAAQSVWNVKSTGNTTADSEAAAKTITDGKTVEMAAGKNLTVKQTSNEDGAKVEYALSDDIKVGNDGKDGKDGVDGKIGVNGKDGSSVVINGKDGSIGLNGKDGKDGLTIKGANGQDGVDGKNGKDGMTRIVYEDKNNNKHEVATTDDGMKYAGDDAQGADKSKVIAKKLNQTLDIVGGADTTKLTDNNIGVNNVDGKLKVQLAQNINLTPAGSLTIGDTMINNGGLTITGGPSVTKTGINAGNLNITNVKAGVNDTDAVNVKQLKDARTVVTSNDKSVTVNKTENGNQVTYDLHVAPGAAQSVWNVKSTGNTTADSEAAAKTITDGKTVEMAAGKNLTVKQTSNEDGAKVEYGLAGDLTNIKTIKNEGPATFTIGGNEFKFDGGNVNMGDNNITNLKSGGDVINNAANIGDVNRISKANDIHIKDKTYTVNADKTVTLEYVDGNDNAVNKTAKIDLSNLPTGDKAAVESVVKKSAAAGDTNIADITVADGKQTGDANAKYEVNVSRNAVKDAAREAVTVNNANNNNNPITVTPVQDETNHNTTYQVTFDGDKAAKQIPLTYKANGSNDQKVTLDKGLNFTNGSNTTASVAADGVVKYDLNNNVNLTPSGSLTIGDTVINDGGLTINNGPSITKGGINAGNLNITNVKAGVNDNDAVNVKQLKDSRTVVTSNDKSVTINKTENGNQVTYDLHVAPGAAQSTWNVKAAGNTTADSETAAKTITDGKTVEMTAGKNLTVKQTSNEDGAKVEYALSDDIKVGNDGKDGKDGVDGKIGVNGKDGSAVVINGKDGSIGLNGKDGKDGLTIRGANGQDGVNGTNGTNGITRIVYEDKNNNKHEVATTDDGLKFTGNNTDVVNKNKLNSLVKVQGEGVDKTTSASFKSASGNINVKADGTDTLEVQLNKDLKNITSIKNDGPATMTIGGNEFKFNGGNVNMGGNNITNLKSGGDVIDNAANIGDVTRISKANDLHIAPTKSDRAGETTTSYSYDAADKSVTLKYNDGNGANQAGTIAKIDLSGLADQIKDGYSFSTDAKGNVVGNHAVTAVGNGKTVSYAAGDNLTITQNIDNATGEQTYTYALSNDIKVGNDGKDGKDGVDGKIGVNGKDGSAVVINGKDGSIGLNGKDGKDGLTIKGANGQDGVDGKNGKDGMTRIVYEDKNNNKHEVATTDDGMKYAGDNGQTDSTKVIAKKLNQTLDITGGADSTKLTENNIGVNNVDGKLKVQLAQNINLTPAGSLTIGDTKITDGGLVINNGPSITKGGINAGDLNITNVKAGVNDTDAVNVKQLKSAKTEVKAGDNVTVDKTIGADGQNIYTVNAKATNLGDAELNYTANGGAKQKVKLSEGLNFVDGNYTKASVDANGVVKYDVTLGKVKDGVDGKPGVDGENGIATVKTVVDTINNSGWKGDVTGNTVGDHSATIVKPGTTVNFGAGKNLTVEQIVDKVTGNHTYNYALSDDIKVGNDGKDGKPGVDGKIGVNGKDGSAVVINGKDGSIGLNGKDGKDGLTFKGANGQDGVDGKNGTNGMTRIVYEDSNNNKHEVATTDDGLKFTGNNESVVNKNKLNSTVKVKGEGVTEEQEKTFESAAGNIAVTADGNDTLNIRLNKNIKGIDSIQTKEIHLGTPDNYTTIKKDGDRIKYGDKTFANTDDIWTIQANGTDVPANGGKVNVKGADGITVSKSANGEMTISGSGLGTMNSFNVKSSGNTTADSETAAKKITDGKTVEFSGGKNLTVKQTSDENGAKVEYALSNNVDLTNKGSVTIGDTKITDGGLVINNGPSVTKDGINAGNKQITNVEDGVNDTDAVNVRQLKAAKTNLVDGQNTKVTGDGSKANPYKVNVEGDLNKITSITNNEGDGKLEFKGDQVVNVAGDNTIKLDGKTGDITGLTNKTLDSADFATKGRAATEEQLKLVQQEAAKKSTEKVQAKADANNIAKVAPKAGDTFGAAGATYEVSVDKNDVKDAAREAVTVSGDNKAITVDVQPNATNHTTNYQVNFNGNEAAKQIPLTYKENGGNARTVMLSDGLDFSNGVNTTAHTDANGKVSFDVKGDLTNITSISNNSNGPKVSFGGDTVNITGGNLNMGGNKVTNVQRGTNDTDAVNVKQLKDSRTTLTSDDQSVVLKKTESADGGLNYDLSVKGAVDPRVDQLNEEIGRVGAQGAALSALKPMQYDPLEPTQIMAGYGNYRGNSAIAVGVAHYKNESTMFHGGLSWAGGSSHMMANAGVTWKVGNRDAEAAVADRYRKGPISSAYAVQTEMAAMKAQNAGLKGEVSDLKYENEQIKAQNAGLQSEVEVLKAQMAAMMAKMGM
ncbi:MAG: ESPR-type extended signal peptide-containing protein [Veillonella sp.]|uniref:ESPR-type extended signal peptide-containing protein n=2 Tax=Bacteria TaxID=2 RepID=UPI002912E9AF|nr:ESPR-type extended signal peptide-containing protein [Veillonella sp.]MDU4763510.1 ESPR-type extended signal peptide-containing protein [Veillonella sp.]